MSKFEETSDDETVRERGGQLVTLYSFCVM